MSDFEEKKSTLQEREARFWDRQEEAIEDLYARPHDWRFVPGLAETIIRPRQKFLAKVLRRNRNRISSLLDIGCGSGWFCHACAAMGIKVFGVDLSSKKITTAEKQAQAKGLGDRCHFYAADIMALDLPEKVDLITAHGSLHHFPDLQNLLPRMVDRFLKPDGLMLFSEPNYEGMPPGLLRFLTRLAESRLVGHWFDKEFYQEALTHRSTEGFNLRGESPAGLEFCGDCQEVGVILDRSGYRMLKERHFHYYSGHLANALYIFMKPRLIKGAFRLFLPFLVALDTQLCRHRHWKKYAEEGVWLLRR